MKVITTADKFRVTEGQLVWAGEAVLKVGSIARNGMVWLVDPTDTDVTLVEDPKLLRMYNPTTGQRACDFAYDAEEVLV